ncbi:Tetratricopeptide repeat protein [Labilithrix luteola]|uniref:Tetratricopeptide repeat protein n=1 Tax=Labilithrix luteola TaxID=1391654 RepID=A0A0K1Q8N0_9BACT|nr:J domain-containing protein [Labilithrix luteola]AKV02089.1 Tetratricopeptide repeat protein [Labilithrix luteola]
MDGFLLTRINGRLGSKDLAKETGLPDFSVERALEKLEKLGVIERIDPNAPPPPAPPPPPPPPPPQAVREKRGLPEFVSLSAPKYDPKELEEECDLPLEQRKRVLDVYYRLEDLDHYTLLGVSPQAEKKAIKRAYFELAALMHPDRYFKKYLGSFKPKMEALFGRITEAHDTLVDRERRADYDSYLAEIATTRGMEAMLERALEEASRTQAPAPAPAPPPPAAAIPPERSSSPNVMDGRRASVPDASPEEIRARKEALARRLLGGQRLSTPGRPSAPPPMRPPQGSQPSAPPPMRPPQGSQPSAPTPPTQRYASASDAMDALKRRYEDRIDGATQAQARRYVQTAEEAFAKGDLVAAATALGIATKFSPNDTALAIRYQETKNQADLALTESYAKQADYEEKSGHWAEAARSWQKVAKLQTNNPRAHMSAARALLRAEGGDLHQAAEHAKRAVAAEPGSVVGHVVLAEIYSKAGLLASAKRAAETGLQVDPTNATLLGIIGKAASKAPTKG